MFLLCMGAERVPGHCQPPVALAGLCLTGLAVEGVLAGELGPCRGQGWGRAVPLGKCPRGLVAGMQ